MEKVNTFIIPIIRSDFIGKMLETLYKHTPDNFYVFVIDQTGSLEAEEKYKHLTHLWIRPYRNLGFSKAMNTGILLSTTPYVTLANDDLEFMNKRWWQGITDTFLMDESIVAVNPMSPKEGSWGYGYREDNKETWQPNEKFVTDETKLAVYPKKPDGSGLYYKEHFSDEDYDFLLTSHPGWSPNTLCDAIAMWCTVFKRDGLEEIGLLEEKFYPGGGEDYDMNCRAYSCAWPEAREECDPKFHRRMVGTTKSWVWHHWGRSKDAISGADPTNKLFSSRPRWNDNDELWDGQFDVWGHETVNGKKKPLKRLTSPIVDPL